MSITPRLDLMGVRFADAGGDGSGGEGGEGESTYTPPPTQADLDRIVEARLARERDKFKDYDELKQAKSQYDELLESQKSEAQKAIDVARGETTTEVSQKFLTRIVSAEVKAVAGSLGFNDPADALQVLNQADLPVKDEEPDTEAIKALVAKLAEDKPYLLKETKPVKPVTRPKPADGTKPEKENHEGKGRAAAALRQLGANRKGG